MNWIDKLLNLKIKLTAPRFQLNMFFNDFNDCPTLALRTENPFGDSSQLVSAAGDTAERLQLDIFYDNITEWSKYRATIHGPWLRNPIPFILFLEGPVEAVQSMSVLPLYSTTEIAEIQRTIAFEAEYLETFRADVIHALFVLTNYLFVTKLADFKVIVDPPMWDVSSSRLLNSGTGRVEVKVDSDLVWRKIRASLGEHRGILNRRIVKGFVEAVSYQLKQNEL